MRVTSILTLLSLGLAAPAAAQAPQSATNATEAKASTARTWLDTWMYCIETEALKAAAGFPAEVSDAELADHSFDLCKTSEATMDKTGEAANASYFPNLQAYRAHHVKWKAGVRAGLVKEIARMRADPAGYAAEAAANRTQQTAVTAQDAKFSAAAAVWEDCLRTKFDSGLTEQSFAAMSAADLSARLESSLEACVASEAAVAATVSADPNKQREIVASLRAQARGAIKK